MTCVSGMALIGQTCTALRYPWSLRQYTKHKATMLKATAGRRFTVANNANLSCPLNASAPRYAALDPASACAVVAKLERSKGSIIPCQIGQNCRRESPLRHRRREIDSCCLPCSHLTNDLLHQTRRADLLWQLYYNPHAAGASTSRCARRAALSCSAFPCESSLLVLRMNTPLASSMNFRRMACSHSSCSFHQWSQRSAEKLLPSA